DVGGAGTIQVSNGTSIFNGTLTPNELIISNGTATLNGPTTLPKLTFQFGTLTGTGDLTLTGASTWSGGTLSGTGRTLIASTGSLDITSGVTLSRVLENQGTATWTAGGLQFNSGQLLNTGTFSANSAGTLQAYGTGGTNNRFTNQGIFRKQGVGTVSIQ
ncbi:hypothetical protein, partial [Nitrospira lenta]|uniref:hypothetical protein n=1 Tax=Nitrospira lenta TaxID=1436998 RepID=UPI0015E8828F